MSIFGMIVVDTMNFHQACVHRNDIDNTLGDFFTCLSEEMIDNTLDEIVLRREFGAQNAIRAAYSPHLSPCKEKRGKNGEMTNYTKQGYCRGYGAKTTH